MERRRRFAASLPGAAAWRAFRASRAAMCATWRPPRPQGSRRAGLALEVFVYEVKKTIGAFAAAMGGLEAVAFTGGIGENSARLRWACCEGLEFLGIAAGPARRTNREAETGWFRRTTHASRCWRWPPTKS